jgi:uncharacterized protein YndB with AHSA1/START domain
MNPLLLAAMLAAAPPPIEKSRTVPAGPGEVYKAFTTLEGVKGFFAPEAKLELKPGGAYEMYFVPTLPPGMKGGEGCQFVSFEPGKQVVFSWNFPPSLPGLRDAKAQTLVTVELQAEGKGTKVKLTQSGFKEGADWEQGRLYFDRAWGMVLARLERRFRRGPIDWRYGWAPAGFDELKWMHGHWRTPGHDEVWSASPAGLIGMYRDDAAGFYELSTVEREGDELVMSMRMFTTGLKNVEKTKAAPLRWVLESVDDKNAIFVGEGANVATLSFRLADKNSLTVTLEKPKAKAEVFSFSRFTP